MPTATKSMIGAYTSAHKIEKHRENQSVTLLVCFENKGSLHFREAVHVTYAIVGLYEDRLK